MPKQTSRGRSNRKRRGLCKKTYVGPLTAPQAALRLFRHLLSWMGTQPQSRDFILDLLGKFSLQTGIELVAVKGLYRYIERSGIVTKASHKPMLLGKFTDEQVTWLLLHRPPHRRTIMRACARAIAAGKEPSLWGISTDDQRLWDSPMEKLNIRQTEEGMGWHRNQ